MPEDKLFSPAWGVAANLSAKLDELGIDYAVGSRMEFGQSHARHEMWISLSFSIRKNQKSY